MIEVDETKRRRKRGCSQIPEITTTITESIPATG